RSAARAPRARDPLRSARHGRSWSLLVAAAPAGGGLGEGAAALSERLELVLDQPVYRPGREAAFRPALAGFDARGDLDALLAGSEGIKGVWPVPDRLHHVFAQHQVLYVRLGDQDALFVAEAARAADVEKALDLLIDAADRLDRTPLIDGARHRERLLDRHLRE